MKKLLLSFLLIFHISVYAEVTPLFNSFVKVGTISADFVQTNTYQGIEPFELDGRVFIIRGNIALWDYKEPREFYLLSADSIEYYSSELNQYLINKTDPADINDSASLLLSVFLNPGDIKTKFNVSEKDNLVVLTPKSNKDISSISIYFKNGVISKVISQDNSGNTTEIIFKKVVYDKDINAGVFNIDIPPGVEIIER